MGVEARGPPEKDTMRCTGSLQSIYKAGIGAGSLESALCIWRAWLKVSGSCNMAARTRASINIYFHDDFTMMQYHTSSKENSVAANARASEQYKCHSAL